MFMEFTRLPFYMKLGGVERKVVEDELEKTITDLPFERFPIMHGQAEHSQVAIRKEVAGLLEGVGSLAPAAMVTLAEGRCVAQWGVVRRRC